MADNRGKTRAQARADIEAQIIEIGRQHLARDGAAALSLRAIARELGMVSSAIYRYVATRDELLTLLVVDAYADLATAVTGAVDGATPDPAGRVLVAAHAFRSWAIDDPARYALLYGSPVPGYHAPAERTVEPGTAVVALLLRLVDEAHRAGQTVAPPNRETPAFALDLAAVRSEFGLDLPDWLILRATGVWAALIGAVSLEVFGQYGADTFTDPQALFDEQLRQAIAGVLT